jgi:hypothetical protein
VAICGHWSQPRVARKVLPLPASVLYPSDACARVSPKIKSLARIGKTLCPRGGTTPMGVGCLGERVTRVTVGVTRLTSFNWSGPRWVRHRRIACDKEDGRHLSSSVHNSQHGHRAARAVGRGAHRKHDREGHRSCPDCFLSLGLLNDPACPAGIVLNRRRTRAASKGTSIKREGPLARSRAQGIRSRVL